MTSTLRVKRVTVLSHLILPIEQSLKADRLQARLYTHMKTVKIQHQPPVVYTQNSHLAKDETTTHSFLMKWSLHLLYASTNYVIVCVGDVLMTQIHPCTGLLCILHAWDLLYIHSIPLAMGWDNAWKFLKGISLQTAPNYIYVIRLAPKSSKHLSNKTPSDTSM